MRRMAALLQFLPGLLIQNMEPGNAPPAPSRTTAGRAKGPHIRRGDYPMAIRYAAAASSTVADTGSLNSLSKPEFTALTSMR